MTELTVIHLGEPKGGTIEGVAATAIEALNGLRRNFAAVAVSFDFNGTRTYAYFDETPERVMVRWSQLRAVHQYREAARRG